MELFEVGSRGARTPSEGRLVVSVDYDGWSSLLNYYSVKHSPSLADSMVKEEDGVTLLLDVFAKHDVNATFFVPGEIVERHPDKVKEISKEGHEVGCHGLIHTKNECLLSKTKQEESIKKSTQLIEDVTGTRPSGFRAPCLRANQTTLEVLRDLGYIYDSSFLPMFLPGAYGSLSFKFKPYFPLPGRDDFLEIPVSANPIIPLPFSGSWLRNLGSPWVKFGIKLLSDLSCPVSLYVHPRDVLELPITLGVPWHIYRNTGKKCLEILDSVLRYVERLGVRSLRALDLAQEELKVSKS